MKIDQLHEQYIASTGVCTDTRKISKGCIFFALKGDNFDGNKFTNEALDKGASKVVIDDLAYHKNTGETILTSNALKLLQKLAAFHRKQCNIPIIGITGSNGKTTSKELIHAVLSKKYNTSATKGNLNNHIGVPLTLLEITSATEIGIVEMGANHQKEIEFLSNLATPDFGYITNFGKAHLEGFGGIEGVILGKSELYKNIKDHNKKVFVNANDPQQMELTQSLDRITFGNEEQQFYIQLKDASERLVVVFDGLEIQSQLIGIYNFHNIAAAFAIGAYFGVPSEKIKEAIEGYIPEMNRSQIVVKSGHKIILDAYNANPTSMMAALENFQQVPGDQKLMILGDMFELGQVAAQEHQAITNFLTNTSFGSVYLVGSNFAKTKTNHPAIQQFESFEDLQAHLEQHPPSHTQMLIKGSRGMALERVLNLL